MVERIIPVVTVLLLISACAGQQLQAGADCPVSSHRCAGHDITLIWNPVKTDSGLRIEGTITNNRNQKSFKKLELTAALLDDHEQVLSKGNVLFQEWFKGPERFVIDLPLGASEVPAALKFSYSDEKDGQLYMLRKLIAIQ